MSDDLDDDTERWRDEKFSPEQREAMQREQLEREARAKKNETLAWCRQRAEAREAEANVQRVGHFGTKSFEPPRTQPTADADYWAAWRNFVLQVVRAEMRGSENPLIKALGQTLGAEFKKHDEELVALRQLVAELQERLVRLEAAPANKTLKLVRDEAVDASSLIG